MRGRRRGAVLLLAAGLVAAGCGARLDEEQLAATQGPAGVAGPQAGANLGPASSGDATATTAPPAQGAAPGAAPAPQDGASPAPQEGGGPAPAPSTCTPEGASDVGVTPEAITIGQVVTISGPVPGLGQTALNGTRAYVQYRNSLGGVCGRELQLVNGDDRLDSGQNRAETARLAQRVFGFAGSWSVADDGGAQVLEGTNIPDVGVPISDAHYNLPNNFSTNPLKSANGSAVRPILEWMRTNYQIQTAGIVWGAQVASRTRAQEFIRDLEAMGLDVAVQREVAITETNYVPVAQEMKNAGVELVMTTLEITGISRLAQAFQQVGYQPKVPYYGAQSYGSRLIELAGPAANGTILGLTHPIIEEAGAGGILDEFVTWNERVNPNQPIDFFTFQGWVAADMLATAIEQAGPAPTRDAVLDQLRRMERFDAHGLVAGFNAPAKRQLGCFVIVTVREERWERVHPANGFACS